MTIKMGFLGGTLGVIIGAALIIGGIYLIAVNAINTWEDGVVAESANGTVWGIVWIIIGLIMVPIGFYIAIVLGVLGAAV